jgi:hypothetical protein
MAAVDERPGRAGLVSRVKAILLTPKTEWGVIDAEPETVKGLYRNYILILAAIGPIAGLIGSVLFGLGSFGISFRPSPLYAAIAAVVLYVLNVAGVYILALIVNALAPTFGGQKNLVQALKVTAYGSTAAWVVGIFAFYPMLSVLGVLGLYSLYLFYLGLPRLMRAPEERALGYTAAVMVIALVFGVIAAGIRAGVTRAGMIPSPAESVARSGTLSYRGQKVDVGKASKAAEELSAAISGSGPAAPATSGEQLQTLLPESLAGGFTRTAVSSATSGVGRLSMATTKGAYSRQDSTIELEISDMGAAGALAGAFKLNSSEQTADGYEKIGSEAGRTTIEKYDRTSKRGEYGVLVGNRYMVSAEGRSVTIGELKDAVKAIDFARLEAMARG